MSEHGTPFLEKTANKPITPDQICASLADKTQREVILGRTQEVGTARGEMYDLRSDVSPESIEVKTGNGAVVSPERNIFTQRMWGCTSLFIHGVDRKALVHLTPRNSSLSYKETERGEKIRDIPEIVARIIESVEPDRTKRTTLSVIIIGNIATEDGGDYSYQTLYDDWGKVKQALQSEGVGAVHIVETPLDETGVYHLSQTPDMLYLAGNAAEIAPSGNLTIHKEIKTISIDLRDLSDSLIEHPQSVYNKEIARFQTMTEEDREQEYAKLELRYNELLKKSQPTIKEQQE